MSLACRRVVVKLSAKAVVGLSAKAFVGLSAKVVAKLAAQVIIMLLNRSTSYSWVAVFLIDS